METQVVNGLRVKKLVGRREGIYSIVVDRLDAVLLREAAKEASLAFGEDDSSQAIAVSLQAFYKRQQVEKKTPLFQCEVDAGGCGADQPKDEGTCPFCGFDPDASVKKEEVVSAAEDGEDEAAVKDYLERKEQGEKTIPAAEVYAKLGMDEPASGDITDPESVLAAAAETAPVEPRRGRGRPKGSKNLPKGREEQPGEMPPAGASTGLAKVVPTSMMVVDDTTPASMVQTARDLDDAIGAFRKANGQTFTAWRHEGLALWEIFSKKLWLLRVDPATKAPKYKTFQQFIAEEIKLTPNYVFDRMDAARAYTEEQAARLGMSNCILLLKAPEEVRQSIEQKIHRGEVRTDRDTRAEVSKAIKDKGVVKTKGTKSGERKTGGGRKREFVKLAIAEQLGKSTIAMMATPAGGEKAVKITDVPAAVEKWLAKVQPFCTHESLDGEITVVEALVVKDGKLSLVIHRSRPADDEAE